MLRTSYLTRALIAGAVSFVAAASFAAPVAPSVEKAVPKVSKTAPRVVTPKAVHVGTEVASEQPAGASQGINQDAGVSSVGSYAPRQV